MAGVIDPSATPAFLRFLPGPVRSVARNLWGTFRFAPWPVKIMLVVVCVGGPSAVVLRYARNQVRAARFAGQVAEWRGFEDAVKTGDEAKMVAALDRVLALAPADPTALGRKKALETGEADPNDQAMVVLSYRRHLRAGRIADADREARKRLAHEKNDWLARCICAAAALQKGDKAAAVEELDQLPSPTHGASRVDPGGLLFAFKLFRGADKDTTPLRQFTQGVILPLLKAPSTAQLPPAEKVALLECYSEGFEPIRDRPQPTALVESWAPAARLADAAADELLEKKPADVTTLARLGRLSGPLEAGLIAIRRGDQVTDGEFAQLAGDLRARGKRVWEAVLAADPKQADAYRGLAAVLLRSLETVAPADRPAVYDQARKALVTGLGQRSDDPELVQMFARLLAVEGQPLKAAELLIGLAKQQPDKPVWWALAAEAAMAAHRRDVALEACARLRAVDPDNLYVTRTEARLWVDAGEPARALPVLARMAPAALARDHLAGYSYARALAETKSTDKLNEFAAAVADAAAPAAVGATARGLSDAAGLPADAVAAPLAALAQRHADHPEVLRAKAVLAYRAAEAGEPLWEVGRVTAAVRAAEQALLRQPNDEDLIIKLGWLRLRGEGNVPQASRTVAPLAKLSAPGGPPSELLGAVALAADDLPSAVRHLERATRSTDATAGAFSLLARAYHATGRPGPARTALESARGRPRNPREQAEYQAAAKTLSP